MFSCDLEEIEDEKSSQEEINVKYQTSCCKLLRQVCTTKITVPPKSAELNLLGRINQTKKPAVTRFDEDKENAKNSLLTTVRHNHYPVVSRDQACFRKVQ